MPSDTPSSASLGSWSQDDFASTVRSHYGIGSNADLPEDVRFYCSVVSALQKRTLSSAKSSDTKDTAVFLLHPRFEENTTKVPPVRKPMIDCGTEQLCGRVWCVSQVVASGEYVDIDTSGPDAFFSQVVDELGLGRAMAVVYMPNFAPNEVRFYRHGLAEPDFREVFDLGTSVNLDKIFEVVDSVHENCLRTPDAQDIHRKLWEKPAKWWPIKEAELGIQMYLKIGLAYALATCIVRYEQPGAEGRLDILVEERGQQDGTVLMHAILELKVLRSFGSSGKSVSEAECLRWMKKGVKQAVIYGQSRFAKECALCCFDMRKNPLDDSGFDEVESLAVNRGAKFRRWILWNSSDAYRDYALPDA